MRSHVIGGRAMFLGVVGAVAVAAGCSGGDGGAGNAPPPAETTTTSHAALEAKLLNASPQEIAAEPELAKLVEDLAAPALAQHCASCHGADLRGTAGVPDLLDGDWIWGSSADDSAVGAVRNIERTLLYGIRNKDCPPERQEYGACADTRFSQMPGYGSNDMLPAERIADVVEYVLQLGGQDANADAATRAETDFGQLCAECHGEIGDGNREFGGPDLTDEVWLFGGDRDSLRESIANGREGVCPPWGSTLGAPVIKALAVHIHSKAE